MDIEVRKGHASVEVEMQQAKALAELVESGVPIFKAAKQLGISKRELNSIMARDWLADEVSPFYIPDPENRRKALIAAMTREMALAAESKDRIAAARVLAKDPEVGMSGNQAPLVNINISDETRKMDTGPMWPDGEDEENDEKD